MKLKFGKFLLLLIISTSCAYDPAMDNSLRVMNLTKDTLYVCEYKNDSLIHFGYKDTKTYYTNWTQEILPDNGVSLTEENWHVYLKTVCKNKQLRLWVFDKKTLNKYSWEQIVNENRYKKKYLVSYDTLQKKLNWTVVINEECK